MSFNPARNSNQKTQYFVANFIFCIAFYWPAIILAQVDAQNQAQQSLFGQPSIIPSGVSAEHDFSLDEMKAMMKAVSADKKLNSMDDARQFKTDAEEGSRTQATMGTWMQGGHSGAWFNQNEDGHGLFVEVLPPAPGLSRKRLLITWFAFLNGRQVWIQALGDIVQEGNRQVARMTAYIYTGGDFPPFFNSNPVVRNLWGTLTLQFNGCNNADLSWTTTYPGYSSGQLDMERLTVIDGSSCNPDLGGDSGGGTTDDYGNTWQTGGSWSTSGRTGNIETAADVDVFTSPTLNPSTSGGAFHLRIWTTGSTDTTGQLFRLSNNSETALEFDDDDGSGFNFLIDREISPGNRYTIHVEAFGTGSYTLWYETRTENQQQLTRVDFENGLLKDVQIFKNGILLGVVPALETRGDNYPVSVGDQFSWEVIQDFGDSMGGIYSTITSTNTSSITYLINNIIGSDHYFIPYITNNTSSGRLLGVNMELQSENRCNCVITANTSNVVAGYFHLWSNGNLRLYESTSSYDGRYTFWENFSNSAQTDTGRINFTLNP